MTTTASPTDDEISNSRLPRLRVPREDHSVLAHPSLDQFVSIAEKNKTSLDAIHILLQGRSLAELRRRARGCLQAIARAEAQRLEISPPAEMSAAIESPLILTGHQPGFFHPGVWVKNIAAAALARRMQGWAVNLIVDSDLLNSRQITVPEVRSGELQRTSVAFDRPQQGQPWEEASIAENACWQRFPADVLRRCQSCGWQPLLSKYAQALGLPRQRFAEANSTDPGSVSMFATGYLRDSCVRMRAVIERSWGSGAWEVPLSRLCESEPFLWFVSHLFAHAERFAAQYNAALADYRQRNRIRSATRPVPELGQHGRWIETPFWFWRRGQVDRSALWARRTGELVQIGRPDDVLAELPLPQDGSACCAVEILQSFPARGLRLRTRALSTTLFSRLCLGDVFLHGIGGAKYDEMTDDLLVRFFRVMPPKYLTLTATKFLPFENPNTLESSRTLEQKLHRLRQELWHWQDSPERTLTEKSAAVNELLQRKKVLIEQQRREREEFSRQSRVERRRHARERRTTHEQLVAVNRRLRAYLHDQVERQQQEIAKIEAMIGVARLREHREFVFPLYPEEPLRQFFASVSAQIADC